MSRPGPAQPSPGRRPVTLQPVQTVPLDAEHEKQAIDALAELFAEHLLATRRRGARQRPTLPMAAGEDSAVSA